MLKSSKSAVLLANSEESRLGFVFGTVGAVDQNPYRQFKSETVILTKAKNTAGDIKPGMICSVEAKLKDNRSGLVVSNKALQKDTNGEQFIYIEKNGQAQKISVQTIALIDNKVLIQGDIPQNANIIISGQQKLSNGKSVKIISK